MSLSQPIVWDVRSTGADTNGGGFKTGASGTNYSRQNSPQYALTGIASAGSGNTVLSASAAADMVGNVAQAISGTNITAGFYEVTSVSVGVSITFSTNNSGGSICTGVAASAVINIGGAFASIGEAGAAHSGGNGINVKSGSYTISSASTNVAGGCLLMTAGTGDATPTWISGYGTTPGDYGTPPVFTASGISTFVVIAGNGNNFYYAENLTVDGASLTSSKGFSLPNSGMAYLCKASNCKNGGISAIVAMLCEITGCATVIPLVVSRAVGCWAHDNTITGIDAVSADWCASTNNTGGSSRGFTTNRNYALTNCVSVGNGGSGFYSPTLFPSVFTNCYAEGNLAYGFDVQGTWNILKNCGGYNNTSGNVSGTTAKQVSFVIVTATAFAAGANNFALNNNNPGGAQLRATGFPGAFPGGAMTGYGDIGVAQHQDSGGTVIVIEDD